MGRMSEAQQPPVELKEGQRVCPYCGKATSASATFCWWCTREIAARPERPESVASSSQVKPWVWFAAAGLILAVVVILIFAFR